MAPALSSKPIRLPTIASASLFLLSLSGEANAACDELASRLIAPTATEAIKSMGCGPLEALGLDQADHSLKSICYSSDEGQSKLSLVVDLRCRTAEDVFIPLETAEEVTVEASVRASDCQIITMNVI